MKTITKLQMTMFPPKSEWVPPSELPDLTSESEIAIDLETKDPDLKTHGPGWATGKGHVVGYAIATASWSGYVPIRHVGGGNLDAALVHRWIKKICECPADKIFHNAAYDVGWLKHEGFTIKGQLIDTMITASLLDENRFSYSLNALAYDYLSQTKNERLLTEAAQEFGVDPKAELYLLPAMYVGPYGEADARLTLDLWNCFKLELRKQDLSAIWELEMALLPCLIEMTWKGIRVDLDRAERTKQELIKREKMTLRKIKKLVGKDVEIWAAQSVAKAFDTVGLSYSKTDLGAPSFTRGFLSEHPHELPELIVEARELNKTHSAFVTNVLRYVGEDGRIHAHINQNRSDSGGTVSGRLSYQNPNLQQLPARHPTLGPMIRSLFLPEEGQQWAAIDYSQQEPRILVHYAKVYGDSKNTELKGLSEFIEGYTDDLNMDFHALVAEMAEIPRKQAKTINLAMMYGMGVNKLASKLDIDKAEAKALTDRYHERVPFVKQLMQGVSRRLNDPRSSGSIRSLRGRKCRFDLWEPDSFEMHKALPREEAVAEYGGTTRLVRAYTYKSLNRLIQASAADMCKQGMVNLFQEGVVPLLQVHDELCFSVTDVEEAKKYATIMEQAVLLEIPNRCDIEIGPSWGEAS
jgi:DNA polymerase I-like protein with 3'-5' exonuclease and polymerase domains